MNTLSAELSKHLARPVEADIRPESVPSVWAEGSEGLRVYVRARGCWIPVCGFHKQAIFNLPYDEIADCICFHLRMRKLPRNTLKIDPK